MRPAAATAPSTPHVPAEFRVLGAALVLTAGGLGVVLAGTPSPVFDLERYTVPKALALHLTALAALALLLPRWRTLRLGMVDLLLAAALAWSAVSALFAVNRWLALHALGLSASALAVYALARSIAGRPAAALALTGIGLAATVAAATGLAQAYVGEWTLFASERTPGGTFGNRNFLAHFTVIALPLLGLLTVRARRRAGMIAGAVGVGLAVAILVLTRSRAAWLAGLLSLAVMALLAARARPWRWTLPPGGAAAVLAALTLGAGAALLLPNRLQWASDSPYRDSLGGLVNYREGSGRGRLVQYRNSLSLVAADPLLGVGPGNWFVHYPRVTTPGDPSFAGADPIPTNPWPSSDWVAFVTERGPVGALLLLLAGGAACLTAWRRAGAGDPELQGPAIALGGVLTAALVTGALDAVLHLAAPAYLVAALTGLLLPPTGAVVERPLAGRRRALAVWGAVAAALLVTVASLGQVLSIRLTADRGRAAAERAVRYDPGSHRLHLRLATLGACGARVPHARAALRLLPYHSWPRQALARCGAAPPP